MRLSINLRERVVLAVRGRQSFRAATVWFGASAASALRWKRRYGFMVRRIGRLAVADGRCSALDAG